MEERIALARQICVVDVDWYVEDDQTKYNLRVDEEKAALKGISEDDLARTMLRGSGMSLSAGTRPGNGQEMLSDLHWFVAGGGRNW